MALPISLLKKKVKVTKKKVKVTKTGVDGPVI